MSKGKSTGKIKNRNTESNRIRRISSEINKCEKKMKKLLRLNEEGRKRFKLGRRGSKTELTKLQGIVIDSERHKALLKHIEMLKGKV